MAYKWFEDNSLRMMYRDNKEINERGESNMSEQSPQALEPIPIHFYETNICKPCRHMLQHLFSSCLNNTDMFLKIRPRSTELTCLVYYKSHTGIFLHFLDIK